MTPFPSFEAVSTRHEAYGGLIVLKVKPQTFGSAILQNQLVEAFSQVAPDSSNNLRHGRATLLMQTADIEVDASAAANNPGFGAIAAFWTWRKGVTNEELIAAAAQIWGWFENVVPLEFIYTHWDAAVNKTSLSAYAAPAELKPVLSEADKANPN